jgi:glutamate dehydrogenase
MSSDLSHGEKKKDALIEEVLRLARERVSKDQGGQVETFVRQYYAGVAPEDLVEREVEDLAGEALAHWSLGRQRESGAARIRVYNPNFQEPA